VILPRILFHLQTALLPLLLLVVMAAGADLRPPVGTPLAIVKAVVDAPLAHPPAGTAQRGLFAVAADLDVDDDTEVRVASIARVVLSLAGHLALGSTIPRADVLPATHPPCAAPPTGPPYA
jgi:hypothetical protein